MTEFDALRQQVLAWAMARHIIPNAKPHVQLMKTGSELGELFDAEIKDDMAGIIDGIGDVLVTLIIYAKLREVDFPEPGRDSQPASTTHEQLRNVGISYGDLLAMHEKPTSRLGWFYLERMLTDLADYAALYDLTLAQCLEAAYDEIKDRRGHLTPEGLFIKETAGA